MTSKLYDDEVVCTLYPSSIRPETRRWKWYVSAWSGMSINRISHGCKTKAAAKRDARRKLKKLSLRIGVFKDETR